MSQSRGIAGLCRKLARCARRLKTYIVALFSLGLRHEQTRFILYELRRVNESIRCLLLTQGHDSDTMRQTRDSFEYQWHEIPEGEGLSSDQSFMSGIDDHVCRLTCLSREWFSGKEVLDLGCGGGRFTCAFLSLGAHVTAVDHSGWGLERTSELCKEFSDRLCLRKANVLDWSEEAAFDLVFCFGVVHHTGNTYLAITNAAKKVKENGKLFLMVYGFPETLGGFVEVNSYEALRQELRNIPFGKKKEALVERFGPTLGHAWFDAISPRINDLLTFAEIEEFLMTLGFENVRRTAEGRNHCLIADKVGKAPSSLRDSLS